MDLEERVISWLAQQDVECYLVGGCVRDRLLKRPIYDLDVATSGDGLRLSRRLANHFEGEYYPLDAVRGTGRAILHLDEERRLTVDVAQFRGPDLAADLADRDFTINALATSVGALDEVIDRHGGLADLGAGLIRTVSDDSIRNDPLRALRAIRQAAQLEFALAPETESLIRQDGGAIAQVSVERIRDELVRLLALSRAAPYVAYLDDLGLLTTILPELEPLRGLAQPLPHRLDAFSHSLETVHTLENLLDGLRGTPNSQSLALDTLAPFANRIQTHLGRVMSDARPRLITLKLVALLHDTGKAAARTVDEEGRVRLFGHQNGGARIVAQTLSRLCLSNAEVRLGETIVRNHMRPLLLANQESVSSRAIYRFFRDAGLAGVDVLVHALADHLATRAPDALDKQGPRLATLTARMLGDYWERHSERVDPVPLIDGHDLLHAFGLRPGPHIGELLEIVREAQVSEEVRTRNEALALVRAQLKSGLASQE